ncbi:MAG: glutamine synthetase family protein [Arenicellales bacterium]|nr:glutamine synthetase family protein [Arenicellales bacterium]
MNKQVRKEEGIVVNNGLWTAEDFAAAEGVLKTVTEHGLETVRISFADQHGILRGKTVLAKELKSAFNNGVKATSTLLLKDTSHATVFPVWESDAGFGPGRFIGASDFLVIPDPKTFRVLPWSPHCGWMLSEIYTLEGDPISFSSRRILRAAVDRLNKIGLDIVVGLEMEFHVFKLENACLDHASAERPEDPPQTSLIAHGYQYLTEQRYDQLEQVMDLIRRNAEALHLPVRSMEAEFGPSQFEFTFHPDSAMDSADNLVLFRSTVKQVCRREGYHATFMCRPRLKNIMSSGWHLHQSVVNKETGENLFIPAQGEVLSKIGNQWVAGLLQHAVESCLLSTPTINGYKRFKPFALAPDRIQWGRDNRGAMIRVIADSKESASRVENRVGESAANPYLYIASQILCGLDGIERELDAGDPVDIPYDNEAPMLPTNLLEALDAFRNSAFYRSALGNDFVDYFTRIKQAEWDRYVGAVSEWEHREYFSLF